MPHSYLISLLHRLKPLRPGAGRARSRGRAQFEAAKLPTAQVINARLIQNLIDREYAALYSSIGGLMLIVLVAGQTGEYLLTLAIAAIRAASMVLNHMLVRTLDRTMAAGESFDKPLRNLTIGVGLAAFNWGMFLWPLEAAGTISIGTFLVVVTCIVAFSLQAVTTALYRPALNAVLIGASAAIFPKIIAFYLYVGIGLPLGFAILVAILVTYSRMLERQSRGLIALQVRKHQISQKLSLANRALSDLLEQTKWYAEHDTLTGLHNRFAFDVRARDLLGTMRAGSTGVVLMIDLDHFKQINDRLGHSTGDAVLGEVGAALTQWALEDERRIVGRWGGEEFIVLFEVDKEIPNSAIIEGVRQRINEIGSEEAWLGCPHLSASIGAATVKSKLDLENAIKAADVAMYHAKNAGRNCWKLAA